MADKKTIKFLKTLSKKELNRFDLYLQSPYFNQSEDITIIYHHLKKFIAIKKTSGDFEEYLKSKTNKVINKINLDNYLSRINKFLLDFISMEQFRNNKFDKNAALMEYLIENDDLQLFDKTYKKTKTALAKEKISFQNYLNRFLLELKKTSYLSVHSANRIGKQNLQETDDALDDFYLTQKFNLAILKKIRERSTNEQFKYTLLDLLQTYQKENIQFSNTLLSILYLALKVVFGYGDNQKHNFEELCRLFNSKAQSLNEAITYNFGTLIRNQARQVYQDDNDYFEFIFKLYKIQLCNNVLYYKGNLFSTLFKNIVDVATRLNKLMWCKKFIEENKDKIIPKEQAMDIANYCKARLSFFSGKFEETRNFINTLHFNDVYNKMALKRLEIMAYFELKEYLFLESLINSFRVSLIPQRSQSLSKQHRNWNKKFIIFITKILKFYTNSESTSIKEVKELKTDLKQQNASNKVWLLEKIDFVLKKDEIY